ncbi:MAG: phosphoenolpyruvate-utilizing N-terminal domain-containing protein, partial [Candidatus Brocadiia bacterium]
MEVLQGIGVSSGVAIGPVYILGREEIVLTSRKVQPEEVPGEIERFRQALLLATEDVSHIREISLSKMPPKYAAIFDAHIAILKDPSLSREIEGFVRERLVVAEHAVSRVFRKYIATLELIDQEYLSQRADDLRDLERRVIAHLAGTRNRGLEKIDTKVILISRYLTPSETATLSKDRILGIATDMGGLTSHASILARALEIPAVVGLRTISNHVSVGDIVIIDGFRGRAIISPNESTVEQYRLMQRDFVYTRYLADLDKMKPCVTEDGVTCSVMANIDHPDEIQTCLDHGASGVGLFRTEFLYLNRTTLPTEEEQYALYSQAISVADGHQITFRTFDIGADKMPIGSINAE